MKSRTSFFNATVLRKDITRFAPVWGLYSLFSLLVILLLWESHREAAHLANNASDIFLSMGIINLLYAPLAAFFLHGDLFKSRMCNALHALPMRREGWFFAHLTSGMLFCIVPNGVSALLAAALLQEYAWVAFLWLAVMVLQYIFFYGVATFACHCAGNPLGAIAIYGIVNFLAVILGFLVVTFYQRLLYGIQFDFSKFARCCPAVRFFDAHYLETHYDNMKEAMVFDGFIAADWRYLGIAAGVGAVLLGLSLLIYRVRQLESAGNLISFRPAAPVFLVLFTFLAGSMLYFIAFLAGPALQYIFLIIGLAAGFFTGRMLLERKIKVFSGKSFLAFGILCVVFFSSLGITALDPVGVTRYVPETENVDRVTISTDNYIYDNYIYDNYYSGITLTDSTDIDAIRKIQADCIADPVEDLYQSTYRTLYIRYDLTNGTFVERYYYVPTSSENMKTLQRYFSSEAAVFQGITPKILQENLRMIEVFSYAEDRPLLAVTTNEDYLDLSYYEEKYGESGEGFYYLTDAPEHDLILQGLFEAMQKDCGSGNLARSGVFYDKEIYAHINLRYRSATHTDYIDIDIFEGCENTIAYLKSLQLAK